MLLLSQILTKLSLTIIWKIKSTSVKDSRSRQRSNLSLIQSTHKPKSKDYLWLNDEHNWLSISYPNDSKVKHLWVNTGEVRVKDNWMEEQRFKETHWVFTYLRINTSDVLYIFLASKTEWKLCNPISESAKTKGREVTNP